MPRLHPRTACRSATSFRPSGHLASSCRSYLNLLFCVAVRTIWPSSLPWIYTSATVTVPSDAGSVTPALGTASILTLGHAGSYSSGWRSRLQPPSPCSLQQRRACAVASHICVDSPVTLDISAPARHPSPIQRPSTSSQLRCIHGFLSIFDPHNSSERRSGEEMDSDFSCAAETAQLREIWSAPQTHCQYVPNTSNHHRAFQNSARCRTPGESDNLQIPWPQLYDITRKGYLSYF